MITKKISINKNRNAEREFDRSKISEKNIMEMINSLDYGVI